ncbi:MAG: peptidoglycan-binding protein [Fibrobacteres bacterium]|nr:peptidoglycan-binding protein [Fibrobacterota bacterium]
MPNPSFDPSRADEPELMKQSKARPPSGDLDFSKFAPRKGGAAPGKKQVYDTSTYLEKSKEEDPWPDDGDKAAAPERKVEIVSVEMVTDVAKVAFDKPIRVRCVATVTKSPVAPAVWMRLQYKISATGPWKDLPEAQSRSIADVVGKKQTLEADVVFFTPNPPPASGQKVFYRAQASHNQADSKESPERALAYKMVADYVGAPEITFSTGAIFPRLGKGGELAHCLGAFLRQLGTHKKGAGDIAVVFGFAHDAKDPKGNRALSESRAKWFKSILDRDIKAWESLQMQFSVKDSQQFLKDLAVGYGWSCKLDSVDGDAGTNTEKAVKAFQNEFNTRFKQKIGTTGKFDKATWNAVHRVLCANIQSAMGKAELSNPDWQLPDYHPKWTKGIFANGADFKDAHQGAELCLFHPSDAPKLSAPAGEAKVTTANNPVEDPALYAKHKIPLKKADPPKAAAKGEIALEAYDPKNSSKRVEFLGSVVELRQYVNLPSPAGAMGRDARGDVVSMRILSKGYLQDKDAAKPLPEKVFVKVIFSSKEGHAKRSKRNSPDWLLTKSANMESFKAPASKTGAAPADGWVYEAVVKVPPGQKEAQIELHLGYAGGDTCEVQVGPTPACDSARVRFVNWRRLWYQLSYRDGTTPPSMDTAEEKARAVFIDFVADPVVKHTKAAAGNVIVGNHNAKEYHTLLKSPHVGQCAHIIFCDKQYDGYDDKGNNYTAVSSQVLTHSIEDMIVATSKPKRRVPNPPVQPGAKLLLSGRWTNTVTGKTGKITLDSTKTSSSVGLAIPKTDAIWGIHLPSDASPSPKHPVRVDIEATGVSGPWGGDGGTPPHNLIVISSNDTIHTMCVLHELGHVMNMVPLAGYYKAPPGMSLSDHTLSYRGHGGSGSHCQWKVESIVPDPDLGSRFFDGHCIMFHQLTAKCELVFCPDCAPFVKAQALRNFGDLRG